MMDNLAPSQRVITMWDEWMMHPPQYAETLKAVRSVYEASDIVRRTVNEKAQSFCMRLASEQSIAQCRDFEISATYILERSCGLCRHVQRNTRGRYLSRYVV